MQADRDRAPDQSASNQSKVSARLSQALHIKHRQRYLVAKAHQQARPFQQACVHSLQKPQLSWALQVLDYKMHPFKRQTTNLVFDCQAIAHHLERLVGEQHLGLLALELQLLVYQGVFHLAMILIRLARLRSNISCLQSRLGLSAPYSSYGRLTRCMCLSHVNAIKFDCPCPVEQMHCSCIPPRMQQTTGNEVDPLLFIPAHPISRHHLPIFGSQGCYTQMVLSCKGADPSFSRLSGGEVTLKTLEKGSLPLDTALQNHRPTMVEFYAGWCEICRELTPEVYKVKMLLFTVFMASSHHLL